MKKVVTILLALVLALSLSVTAMAEGISYALVTDVGNIDDQSFNQGTWEGVKNFAAEKGLTENVDYAYYKPSEDSDDARLETIKAAIDAGAKVVVLPGYLFDAAVMTAAGQYPDVNFLAVDLDPDSFPANVTNIKYTEEVSGYLAGYAVVKDGYTKLGFLGGINVPAVIRYGFGYIQGADAAAQELGVQVSVKYWYSGSFAPNDEIKAKMDSWYADGTEVVFACGGGILYSCIAAAEEGNGKIIGVDTDQGYISDRIITSAYKLIPVSVQALLEKLDANQGKWPEDISGKNVKLGINEGAVGLPTAAASWRFAKFTVDEYNTVYEAIKAGTVTISDDITANPTTSASVTVDYQN
ncbi:MAG: BMP family ABC transporter substrate-binding protein [Candidatus Limiplasma sp.]|nr:BMP family ABC transporter substrate-binding protein [Candidatus Limiplasma sp.]